jgi:hypothetical protein
MSVRSETLGTTNVISSFCLEGLLDGKTGSDRFNWIGLWSCESVGFDVGLAIWTGLWSCDRVGLGVELAVWTGLWKGEGIGFGMEAAVGEVTLDSLAWEAWPGRGRDAALLGVVLSLVLGVVGFVLTLSGLPVSMEFGWSRTE